MSDPGLFQRLRPMAQRGPVALLIVAEDDALRVTVTHAADRICLSVIGSADDLDRDLVASLTAPRADTPTPVADQVKAGLASTPAAAPATKTITAKKARPARVPPGPAKKPKKKPAARPAPHPAPKPKAAQPKPADSVRDFTAAREACITEFVALNATHGAALDRELFIKHAKTGRRFERLWTGWRTFAADGKAAAQPDLFGTPTAPDAETKPPIDETLAPTDDTTSAPAESPAPIDETTPPADDTTNPATEEPAP